MRKREIELKHQREQEEQKIKLKHQHEQELSREEQQTRRKEMELKMQLQQQQKLLEFESQQVTMTFENKLGEKLSFKGDVQKVTSLMSSPQFSQGMANMTALPPSKLMPSITYPDSDDKH